MQQNNQPTDREILNQIQRLVSEEHRLYGKGELSVGDRDRLHDLEVSLDQCWDLLRRRRALRRSGQSPNEAEVRPADVVEGYEE